MTVPASTSIPLASQLMSLAFILPLLAAAGCSEKPAPIVAAPTPVPAPLFEPGPKANRSGGTELSRIDEAMKIADVEFLIRTGTTEAEILNEIAVRGLVEPVTAAQANALSTHGASARLIALMQDRQYVLTPPELAEYNARSARRAQKGAPVRSGDAKQRAKEFEERQQRIHTGSTPAAATTRLSQ